jgi:hypothetical protein
MVHLQSATPLGSRNAGTGMAQRPALLLLDDLPPGKDERVRLDDPRSRVTVPI